MCLCLSIFITVLLHEHAFVRYDEKQFSFEYESYVESTCSIRALLMCLLEFLRLSYFLVLLLVCRIRKHRF